MLRLRQDIDHHGIIIPLRVHVSSPREIQLRAHGRVPPKPFDAQALVDTGADCTLIDDAIVEALSLTMRDRGTLTTLGPEGSRSELVERYDVDIQFVSGELLSNRFVVVASKKSIESLRTNVVLGRNLLQYCTFTYNGPDNEFVFEV